MEKMKHGDLVEFEFLNKIRQGEFWKSELINGVERAYIFLGGVTVFTKLENVKLLQSCTYLTKEQIQEKLNIKLIKLILGEG